MEGLTSFLAAYIMAFLGPELAKLLPWMNEMEERKAILRLISAIFAFCTAFAGVLMSGEVASLEKIIATFLSAVFAFFGALIQHKLSKTVRQ